MDRLGHDLRLSLRLLVKHKAFTITVFLTLALCFAANIALFSVVHNVLLRPLPVPDSKRLLIMGNAYPKAGSVISAEYSGVPDYDDRLRSVNVLEVQALVRESNVNVEQHGVPTRVRSLAVTPSYFHMLRVAATVGRTFIPEEGEVGHEKKVVLTESFWRSQFAGDSAAIGRDLRIDGERHVVVGVMPRSLEPMHPGIAFWRALAFTPADRSDENRHSNNYTNLGRLKPGASLSQAQAQVNALNAANLERFPELKELLINAGFHTVVSGWQERMTRWIRPTLYLLWGGALFVLLIGCVNVANLVLVRARARLKETATRMALGAGRRQLARQFVLEGWILGVAASAAGVVLAHAALRAVGTSAFQDLPYGSQIGLDASVLLYAFGLIAVVGTLIGLLPLAGLRGGMLGGVLREEGRSATGGRGAARMRRSMVSAQVAFTLVLLIGAGLLGASLQKVIAVDPGLDPEGVLTASVVLPSTRYTNDDAIRAFTEESLRRLRAIPGVVSAGAADPFPLSGDHSDSVIIAEGYQMRPGESLIAPRRIEATPGFFEAMGVRLAGGRLFEDRDTAASLPVVIIDRKLASHFWPNQDPIGRRMYQPSSNQDLLAVTKDTVFRTVVGVIEDVTLDSITEGPEVFGAYYFPMTQSTSRAISFAVKTNGSPEALSGSVRAALSSLDRELPVFSLQTMEQRLDAALVGWRSPALLSLGFGVTALILSAIGIYGVLAYLVVQRRKEIGIRMALGSTARGIFDLVVREGAVLVVTGLVLGAAGALALRRTLESLLFGVRATDPWVLVPVTAFLAAIALAACAVPARRAARIDPASVLAE